MFLFYNIPKNVKVIKSNIIIIKRLAKYFVSLGLNKKLDGMNPILTGYFTDSRMIYKSPPLWMPLPVPCFICDITFSFGSCQKFLWKSFEGWKYDIMFPVRLVNNNNKIMIFSNLCFWHFFPLDFLPKGPGFFSTSLHCSSNLNNPYYTSITSLTHSLIKSSSIRCNIRFIILSKILII